MVFLLVHLGSAGGGVGELPALTELLPGLNCGGTLGSDGAQRVQTYCFWSGYFLEGPSEAIVYQKPWANLQQKPSACSGGKSISMLSFSVTPERMDAFLCSAPAPHTGGGGGFGPPTASRDGAVGWLELRIHTRI